MRMAKILLAVSAVMLALWAGVSAQDKKGAAKEVTLKGNITCAKCELKKEEKCTTVIVVKVGKKDVIYYFDAASHKEYHDEICTAGKVGSVTGTVTKDGKKLVIAAKKVEFQ